MRNTWFIALFFLISCSDRPKREVFPGPQGETTDAQTAKNRQATLGGFDGTGGAQVKQEFRFSIEGKIQIAKSTKLSKARVLFIAIRPAMGGPPIAAKKIVNPEMKFPIQFKISSDDKISMGGPASHSGLQANTQVVVTAKWDQDGDPLSVLAGDGVAQFETILGVRKVELILEKQ